MHPALEEAMNQQIRAEFSSAYSYLAMAAYVEGDNWPGIAHWLKMQAQEEHEHAMRFFNFVLDRGGKVALQGLPQPHAQYESLREVFVQVVEHEKQITGLINNLYGIAQQEKDYASIPFLQEFLTEQVEEEKSANDVLTMVTRAGGSAQGLMMIDQHLGRRGAGH
ncbi:MAG TPA: ferritin [Symbiobacteriaceae bacterium]|nr:ferritin [Symbiobacteriaceae bacterium]